MCGSFEPSDKGCIDKGREDGGKSKTEIVSLYGDLVAEKAAHACALMDNIRLQLDRKKAAEVKEEDKWLLAVKMVKQKFGAATEL